MLCRFRVLLPFELHVPAERVAGWEPHGMELAGMGIKFFPPYRSCLRPGDINSDQSLPLDQIVERLIPMEPQPSHASIRMGDEHVVVCDVIQIEFRKESFDRTAQADDPSRDLAFSILNDWLSRLRLLAQAPQVKTVDPTPGVWKFEYLNDDGAELRPADGLYRTRQASYWNASAVAMNTELWEAVGSLPWGYKMTAAETLLLDAKASTQEVGPALVLAATALETRISQALESFAQSYGLSAGMWRWINERDRLKQPSTEEQFDSLLRAITGRSLKEEPRLWESFKNLRNARNKFAHEGVPRIGTEQVERPQAARLIQAAREIVDWVEQLLPEAERRPELVQPIMMTATIRLASPAGADTESAGDDEAVADGPTGMPPADDRGELGE